VQDSNWRIDEKQEEMDLTREVESKQVDLVGKWILTLGVILMFSIRNLVLLITFILQSNVLNGFRSKSECLLDLICIDCSFTRNVK
jgi:hypothetical protein